MEITQVAPRDDDPDYIPIEQAMVVRRRSKRKAGRNRTEQEVEMDTATSAPERTETSTSAGGSGKKRRGERSKNKLPKETYNVIALDQDGKPIEPPIVRSKFSNACGTLVRTRCPINVKLWETVDDNIKTLLWNELQKYFVFPPGSEADWDTFVADRTTAEALALRKKMSELAKKNKYPHRLGSSGYAGHVDQWREIEQRFAAAGKPLLVDPMVERSKNWVWARSTGQVSDEGDILFETPDIEEVTTNLQQIVEKERSGQFVPRRERDQLTAALGTAEHSGRNLVAGGADTSAVTVEWAMSEVLKNPAILAKATKELDNVVGSGRLVTESDIPHLPYVDAIMKETMRMHPVAPLLIPRMSREDATVAGYDVPAGTRVLVNTWTISRDPSLWDSPEEFRPERFVGSEIDVKGRDFELLPFGTGRRMCPGYSLGLKVIQLALANLLHAFSWNLPDGIAAGELSMEEIFGLTMPRKIPLLAVVKPRLPDHLYAEP
nr:geraniol 8-hydroxylase-like [Oryza sativa Japonica Group]